VHCRKRQGRCLAVASEESGGRLLAVASAAAGQAGTQAAHSCQPLLLACKALRSQLARPALDHRQDHGAVSFLHRRKLWLVVVAAQEIDAGVRTGRGEGWSRHVGTCFQEDRTVAKLLGAWPEPHSQGAVAVPCSR